MRVFSNKNGMSLYEFQQVQSLGRHKAELAKRRFTAYREQQRYLQTAAEHEAKGWNASRDACLDMAVAAMETEMTWQSLPCHRSALAARV